MLKTFFLYFINKITSYSADYQTFPALFELECSTITTMREKLLLSAVSIDEKKTCIRLRFSQKAPALLSGTSNGFLSEKPCGAEEMRTNRTATAKTTRGGYE